MSDSSIVESERDVTETIQNLVDDIRFRTEQYDIGTCIREIEWNQCRNYTNDEEGVEGFDIRVYGEYVPIFPITHAVNESVFQVNELGHMNDMNDDSYVMLFIAPREGDITDSMMSENTDAEPVVKNMTVFEAVQLHQPVSKDDLYDSDMLSQYSKDEINNTLVDLLNDDVIYFDLDWNLCIGDENGFDYDSVVSMDSDDISESLNDKERLSVGELSDLKNAEESDEYSYSVTPTVEGDNDA